MNSDASGWLWLVIDVGLVVVLAGALIYGTMMWSRWKQSPEQAAERDRKTRELFDKR
jgi:flagellar basal body-associated protein FliL